MKWISLLLCVYLLGLTLWPCQDEHPLSQPERVPRTQVSAATSPAEHDHDHCHLCSPFCTCVCCATTVTAPASARWDFELLGGLVPASRLSFPYVSPHLTAPVVSIWQPPKLPV